AAGVLRRIHVVSSASPSNVRSDPRNPVTTDTARIPRSRRPAPAPSSKGAPPSRRRRVSFSKRLRRDRSLIIMTLPMVALLLVFAYVPILGTVIAFQDYSPFIGIRDSPCAALRHVARGMTDPAVWSTWKNTSVMPAGQLETEFPIPSALAMRMESILSAEVRTVLPAMVWLRHSFAWAVVASVFRESLGGAGLLSQFTRESG